jgi:putative ABC transport system ATP-binding protein
MSEPQRAAPIIALRQVVKEYPTAAGAYVALRGLDLAIHAGEFVAIVGRSGSGKSTLLNMITGIDRASAGSVRVAGQELTTLSEAQLTAWRGVHVGIVFQFFQLLPTLTVIENVMLPMDFCGVGRPAERAQRAAALLERVDLPTQRDRLPAMLSGGQQQRVAIARALANDPPIIIADEPTGNLDSRTAAAIIALFEELVGQGKTVVMVTHDDELAGRARRAIVVADGQVVGNRVRGAAAHGEGS